LSLVTRLPAKAVATAGHSSLSYHRLLKPVQKKALGRVVDLAMIFVAS
jgi:hypothetical protein